MMYVCVCQAKTADELRSKVKLYTTVQEMLANEDVANSCQQCLDEIEKLFEKENCHD